MKTSCIAHPQDERFIIIRPWQIKACDGNHCAAVLLSLFELGHNAKLANQRQAIHNNEVAERHGDIGQQDVTLLQWYCEQELEDAMLGLYKRRSISEAIQLLITKEFISIHHNPNPRYQFDRTRYILFHPEKCSQVIDILDQAKTRDGSCKNAAPSCKNAAPIPKISSEISSEREDNSPFATLRGSPDCPPDAGQSGPPQLTRNDVHRTGKHTAKAAKWLKREAWKDTGQEWLYDMLVSQDGLWQKPAFVLDLDWWHSLDPTYPFLTKSWLQAQFYEMRSRFYEGVHPPYDGNSWKKFIRSWIKNEARTMRLEQKRERRYANATQR